VIDADECDSDDQILVNADEQHRILWRQLTQHTSSVMQMHEGKPNTPASRSHAGGIISMKEGSTATKERSGNGNGNVGGGELKTEMAKNVMLSDRSRGRRLVKTMENRRVISVSNCRGTLDCLALQLK